MSDVRLDALPLMPNDAREAPLFAPICENEMSKSLLATSSLSEPFSQELDCVNLPFQGLSQVLSP